MEKRVEKGGYGYADYRKQTLLFKTLGEFLAVSFIFCAGYLICGTKNNICTVIAIILVLPAARCLTAYMMFAKAKTPGREMYEALAQKTAGFPLLSDCVMTCRDKKVYVDFAVVTDTAVYCYAGDASVDAAYFEKGVSEFIASCGDTVGVKLFSDFDMFVKRISALRPAEKKEKKVERIKNDFLILVL
ncbi:MAG: hypothetical protein NC086_10500 [Alistipes sp.]|nr:hypothetical protein [Alistipes sp.]